MSTVQTKPETTSSIIEDIKKISKLNNEPKCITDHRLSMWDAYQKEPFADRVQHLWKYSDPKLFELNNYVLTVNPDKSKFTIEKEYLSKGIIFTDINEIFKLDSLKEIIKNKFGQLVKKTPGRITFLNEATWTSGYFLYVPKGIKLNNPLIVTTTNDQCTKLKAERILIILEEETSVNLVDKINPCREEDLLTNVVIEMYLSKGAKLNYLNLQTHNKKTTHHLFQRAQIEEHAELTNLIVALGGKISKADLGASLIGHAASISTYGIVLGDETQRFDHHTTLEHIAPYTKSLLNFRVVLKDKARSAYTGNLKITHEAIKSDAYQENRNLLLSPEAKAESIPELEILTNDVVRCSHGVTVGQVDKDQIYYLMSRGLTQPEAERVITEGFLEPTISRIPSDDLKDEILAKIKNKTGNS